MKRYQNLRQIQQLDPVQDHQEICRLMAGYEFPWDINRALEIALFRTFCVPSISKLLDKTGEFHTRPQKRYDDTALIVAEILKWGYDSDRGREAIRRMNHMHGRFQISNADFLYVLSTFIYEPVRWLDRFGWRPMSRNERLASFYFWQAVGQRMQIQNIPETYEAFERYNLEYEREHFRYAATNRLVGDSTQNLLLSWFPRWLRPLVKPSVHSLLDERMLDAYGFSAPPVFLQQAIAHSLRLRGRLLRWLPPRQRPKFYTDAYHRSYPNGYQLTQLGPPHMLESLNHCTKTK